MEGIGYTPVDANYSRSDGTETYVGNSEPNYTPWESPAPYDGVDSPAASADGGVSSNNDGGPDGGPPDAPEPGPPAPPPPPPPPYEPEQIGFSFGVDLNVTVIAPFLSNGGGTYGVTIGIDTNNGSGINGYSSLPDGNSNGFGVGLGAGIAGSVGWPTSEPSNVVGGSAFGYGGSLSSTPSDGNPGGQVGGSFGFSLGPPGLYSTQTTTTNLLGGSDPEAPELNGGQCIEGDTNGDGFLSEDELKALNSTTDEC